MEYLIDLGVNIAANVVFWLVLGLVARYILIRRGQADFLRFFGLETSRKLVVYLSNLWLPSMQKPWGCVVSGLEFKVTRTINSLFGSAPFSLPELVKGLVDSFWIGKYLDIAIEVSPLTGEFELGNNMIVVGATQKNSVRRYYANGNMLYLMIDGEPMQPPSDVHTNPLKQRFVVMKGNRVGEKMERPGEHNLAIIEKIHDEEYGTVVFMCTGLHGDTSWAATEYLARNWRELYNKFRDRNFARCLWFRHTDRPMEDYEEPIYIHDFPEFVRPEQRR